MEPRDAAALLAGAVPQRAGIWADLGSGEGTFTRALVALLGPNSRIYAVDRNARVVASLEPWAAREASNVIPVEADFAESLVLPGVKPGTLDGMLFANSLHYLPDPQAVLARLTQWLRPRGRVVIVEYDRRSANRWVPYPITPGQLATMAASLGLSTPTVTARRPSAYSGEIYVAFAVLTPGAGPGLTGSGAR
jgi:ubiquinone/menaquinone biosynthesis C-methylase UbiE